tara:strand:- start:31987 stop:32370 length:384 start_codon:yes stop_codon:yes gene_type:complete
MSNKNLPSNKSFGLFFSFIFIIISLYPLKDGDSIRIWSLSISLIFLVLGLLNSNILRPLNKAWFRLGVYLGNIISPMIMAAIFFIIITPIGFLMRVFNKNLINLKKEDKKSYWIKKQNNPTNMSDQF